jgi:hypothetical protein
VKKLERADIQNNEDYLKERETRRKQIIALKNLRRIEVGDRLAFTFENRETARYQIQEMMRVEHITDEQKMQYEIDVYNDLIPEDGSLSATMFIQITDPEIIKPVLDSMQGLDRADTVFIRVGGDRVFAEFEAGHSKEDRISAVHYVRFRFTPEQIARIRKSDVQLVVQHPAYQARTVLSQIQKDELAKDFEALR